MGTRRKAREFALQILYQLDAQDGVAGPGAPNDEQAVAMFWRSFVAAAAAAEPGEPGETRADDPEARGFAESLVKGVRAHQAELDALIQKASKNWRLERMARVDRNLLRLALYELKFADDVPAKVAINEAIEIAKRFGTGESSAFVNGILDRCKEELGKK
jgi:transcription antitermination protein NusB